MKKLCILSAIILLSACGTSEKKNEAITTNKKETPNQVQGDKNKVIMKTVNFKSEGLNLVGNLYYPPNFEEGKQYPTIVCSGSWTTVKEQMAGLYAKRFAEKGFITLAYKPAICSFTVVQLPEHTIVGYCFPSSKFGG